MSVVESIPPPTIHRISRSSDVNDNARQIEEATKSEKKNQASSTMPEVNYTPCTILYCLQKVFAASMFFCLLTWIFGYAGGVGFDRADREFYFHPMLMSFAFIFVNGEAITLYRGCRFVRKTYTKTIHGCLQFFAFILACLALKAAWDSHDYAKPVPIPNLYSFHSWVGISTFTLFIAQFLGGFLTFGLPFASMDLRKKMMPYHRLGGITAFIMTFASAMLGYSEKAAWSFKCWTEKKEFCDMMLYGNLFALSLVLYSITVIWVVIQHEWIRKPLPSETHVPISQDTTDL